MKESLVFVHTAFRRKNTCLSLICFHSGQSFVHSVVLILRSALHAGSLSISVSSLYDDAEPDAGGTSLRETLA